MVRAWRRDVVVTLACLAAALVLRWPAFTRSVLDWDESLYGLMAAQWRAGHLPYTETWDNKPVGIYAIFALFQAVCGNVVLAARLASAGFVALGAFAVFGITRAVTGGRGPAVLAAAAYLLAGVSNDGLAANTESFMAAFTALAVLAALSVRRPVACGLVAGLLMGAAFMTKYVALCEDPAILFLIIARHPWRVAPRCLGPVVVGGALPLAAVTLSYWHAGALGLWWTDSVAANFTRAGAPVSHTALRYIGPVECARWGSLFAGAFLMVLMAAPLLRRPRDDAARVHWFLVFWLLGGCLGVAAAKSFYDHYFLQLLPVLCVALGWLAWRVAARVPRLARPFLAAAVLAWPGVAAAQAWNDALQPVLEIRNDQLVLRPDEPARVAAALAGPLAASPNAAIYVFDSQPVIYSLVHHAPPTRFAFPSVLTTVFLARVARVDPVAEVTRILSARPLFVVCAAQPAATQNTLNKQVYAVVATALAAHYRVWLTDGNTIVYRLQ